MNKLVKGLFVLGSVFLLASCGELKPEQVEERVKGYDNAAVHEKYAAVKTIQTIKVNEHTGDYEDLEKAGIKDGTETYITTEFSVLSTEQVKQVESAISGQGAEVSMKWEAHGAKGLKFTASASMTQSTVGQYMSMAVSATMLINDDGLPEKGISSTSTSMNLEFEVMGEKIKSEGKISYDTTIVYEYLTQAEYDALQEN